VAAGWLESIRQKQSWKGTPTAVKKPHHIVSREEKTASATLEKFAKANGQILLPLVELITQARIAVDEVIDSIGRQTIETILRFSAEQVARPRTPGESSGDIRWHGSQDGRVSLADRQIKVKRPWLRHKHEGEVNVPAYESLQENSATAQRMMGATPAIARVSLGASRSAGALHRWPTLWSPPRHQCGGHRQRRRKHVLGIELGATENAAAVKQLFTNLREQGLPTDRKYLFVIDGAKALRTAIEEVFGADQPVQRCRNH
jgi:hypothetical protein